MREIDTKTSKLHKKLEKLLFVALLTKSTPFLDKIILFLSGVWFQN
jgi:hypothetical protein